MRSSFLSETKLCYVPAGIELSLYLTNIPPPCPIILTLRAGLQHDVVCMIKLDSPDLLDLFLPQSLTNLSYQQRAETPISHVEQQ